MTDEVQAPAPAEQSPMPEPQVETDQQEAQEATTDEAKPEPQKPTRSRREALEQAFKKLDGDKDEDGEGEAVKVEPKEPDKAKEPEKKADEAKDGPQRGPDGKFETKGVKEKTPENSEVLSKDPPKGKFSEPPARFSEDAKKEWDKAPESVRAEVQRATAEMEKGLKQYQSAVEPIKPFLKMAGGDPAKLAGAMQRYVNTENMLRENPIQGFTEIARNLGYTREQLGRALLGEDPGKGDPRDQEIHQLRATVQQLQQQTGQISQSMQMSSQMQAVQQFAQQHPRFDELAEEMAQMLSTGYAKDLKDAYTKAERMNPAPAPEPEPAPYTAPAQTRPSLSVTGAPSSGSNPANGKPSKTRREALQRAFGRAGF